MVEKAPLMFYKDISFYDPILISIHLMVKLNDLKNKDNSGILNINIVLNDANDKY
ncbi:hypothetical protein HNP81_002040 [Peribacillus huizhouensis]|uniref:Uncharacterized protein n=1 Tax=Peribacillus huizhouensis TaxID=1501239 RepID=A0ABR6CP21_9BACI|nr:hypothetical protein [Peribacillus huizhouensis]